MKNLGKVFDMVQAKTLSENAMTSQTKAQEVLTALKEFAYYDEESGWFIATKTRKGGKVKVGKRLGTYCTEYLNLNINKVTYWVHHLVWLWKTGDFPAEQIDHKDGNGRNNRWANLREVSNKENCRNSKKHSNNTSGMTGVNFHKGSWRSYTRVNYKQINHGSFPTKELAKAARDAFLEKNPQLGFTKRHGQ